LSAVTRPVRDPLPRLRWEAPLPGCGRQPRGRQNHTRRHHLQARQRRTGRPDQTDVRRLGRGVARQPRQTAENDPHRYALDRHLLPRFGSRKLGAITTDDVARLVAEMRKAGYAGWTITGSLT